MSRWKVRMVVLGRECRILGGGRRSFAEFVFVGTSFHVDMFVEACDLIFSLGITDDNNDVPPYCIC